MVECLSPGVYIDEIEMGAKPIAGVSTSTVGFVGVASTTDVAVGKPTFISSWMEFVSSFGRYSNASPYLASAVYGFFANGGNRCYVVRTASSDDDDLVGTTDDEGKRTGLASLEEIDEVSIVCIPGGTSTVVQTAMITHCAKMGDRVAIFDSAEGETMEAIQTRKDTLSSDAGIGALYYPWIKMAVETVVGGKVVLEQKLVPPSGAVAGIYARSDSEKGVHKAPANEIVRGALSLEKNITKAEQDILNPLGINCIRAFKGRGIRVWGARTISSDPLWKYVNVRRLFLYLEESIDESTQWVVFEPNNEQLWARVAQSVNNFLLSVWKSGALMGSTPEEAFFVRCDRTTMTQSDIDNGKLIVRIGVAPTKPAEFVIFEIGQWTASAES
ncbi:phage tail sheath subtilisin-like domain-containing protein [Sulfurovum mangrovi]|uniref:phage tail sheath subtilisin-like domain-containing protein n=1 Tax=Sulfurovum mangrovi TaxID=2893889 RepID=UPI001E4CD3E9|nr:phage tail sheath family protein [Sulfurovum mangrovi]UFH59975.1 phage tail sheath family protein [Sulfurovum mangrovi]